MLLHLFNVPHELKGFEERLISRFVVRLTTDVQPPDLETRTAILSRKARADGLDLPMDVLEYIATRVTTNIRELEGALIRVSAFASLNKQPIDRTLAKMVPFSRDEAPSFADGHGRF